MNASATLKKTPLHAEHLALGARMVPFGGWDMPVQYEGVLKEHQAVREKAGLFDISHMGEIRVRGAGARAFLNHMTTNDIATMTDGRCQYNLLCQPDGGVVDDIVVCRLTSQEYLVVVNASNIAKDEAWLRSHQTSDVEIINESDAWALVAVQGPKASTIVAAVLAIDVSRLKYYHFMSCPRNGLELMVSRTGYTGEDGFEIFIPVADAPQLWRELLQGGSAHGLAPVGLGARDMLRLEAAYPLYGHELSESINPLEAGLGWVVKLDKGDFIGREALQKIRAAGPGRQRIGFEIMEPGIAREGCTVSTGNSIIGAVTSGTHSPTLGKSIGLALVKSGAVCEGENILLDIRGKKKKGLVVKTPFYSRKK